MALPSSGTATLWKLSRDLSEPMARTAKAFTFHGTNSCASQQPLPLRHTCRPEDLLLGNRTRGLRKHVVGIRTDEAYRPHHNDQNYRQHHSIFCDVLALFAPESLEHHHVGEVTFVGRARQVTKVPKSLTTLCCSDRALKDLLASLHSDPADRRHRLHLATPEGVEPPTLRSEV